MGFRSRCRINPRPTRFVSGKTSECRWRHRRYQVDPWSRGREVAHGVLDSSPNPKKKAYFVPSEWDRDFFSPVFYTATPKCVCIRRLAGARHVSPAVSWTLWPEGGSEPLTSAPRSAFMAQSLVLSMSVEDSESLRFEWNEHLAEFFSGRSWPNICPGFFFSVFFFSSGEVWKLFFSTFVLIVSGTEIFWRVSLKIKDFLQHGVSIVIGLNCLINTIFLPAKQNLTT